jgi:hypothetical protein
MRIKRTMISGLLATLGAMSIVLNGTPAMAREIMTWNIQGATSNGGAPIWPAVLRIMIENNKEITAIQEAGDPNVIAAQLEAAGATGIQVQPAAVANLPQGFLATLITFQFQAENYEIYLLSPNVVTDPRGLRVALVLRGVQGANPQAVTSSARRPALGITVGNTTYFSVHATATNQDPSTNELLLNIAEAGGSSPWVALGDWNTDISNPDGINFFATRALAADRSIRLQEPNGNTQNARTTLRSRLDYAFSNYNFTRLGQVIGDLDANNLSDHLPVNYDDTPASPGSPPPAPPSFNGAALAAPPDVADFGDWRQRADRQHVRFKRPRDASGQSASLGAAGNKAKTGEQVGPLIPESNDPSKDTTDFILALLPPVSGSPPAFNLIIANRGGEQRILDANQGQQNAPVIWREVNGGNSQQWLLTGLTDRTFNLTNVATNQALTVTDTTSAIVSDNGTEFEIEILTYNNTTVQFSSSAAGGLPLTFLKTKSAGKSEFDFVGTVDGSDPEIIGGNTFYLRLLGETDKGEFVYKIHPDSNNCTLALESREGKKGGNATWTENGANETSLKDGTSRQWVIEEQGDKINDQIPVRLRNIATGQYLTLANNGSTVTANQAASLQNPGSLASFQSFSMDIVSHGGCLNRSAVLPPVVDNYDVEQPRDEL